jgi:putative transposase
VKQLHGDFSLQAICCVFGKSRQAYYKHLKETEQNFMEHTVVVKLVQEIRKDLPRTGVRKLYHLLEGPLAAHNIDLGRDKLFYILSLYGLLVRKRRRTRPFLTDSNHPFYKYPNLIRELEVICPNQLWVSDITFVRLASGFCYLSLITDAYSRKIVGYRLCSNQKKEMVIAALDMALEGINIKRDGRLIHHSDRGLQYCSADHIALLDRYGIAISMTEKSDPYENAIAERVNGILKEEFYIDAVFDDLEAASEAVDSAIYNYNYKRPHASCDYLTPHEAHQRTGKLQSRWKKK